MLHSGASNNVFMPTLNCYLYFWCKRTKHGCNLLIKTPINQHFYIRTTLQSRTGPVQGQYRVFPVYFSHTGKNLFSLQGSQLVKTGFSLLGKVHREIPVFITGAGLQCTICSMQNDHKCKKIVAICKFWHNQD